MTKIVLTSARRRALLAVQQGLVTRRYHKTGNVIEPGLSGVSARTFWDLIFLKWIEDGKSVGDMEITAQMKLTKQGEKLLNDDH